MTELRVPIGASPRDVVAPVFRHRGAALVCYLVIVGVTGLYCFFWPPSYEASVRYLVKNTRLEPVLTAEQDGIRTVTPQSVTDADLNSEAEIMQSHGVLEQTVRERGLQNAPEHWAVRLLRAPIEFGKRTYNTYHGRPDESAHGRAIRRLAAAIDVEPQRESSVILVRLRWGHPRAAEEILKAHSEAYLASHLAVHRAPDSTRFFAEQTERVRADLARIDAEIAAIRPGATSAQIEADRALAAQQASAFEAEWRKARAEQDEGRARLAGAQEQLQHVPHDIVLQDRSLVSAEALETLKLRVLELRLLHTELLQKYDASHRQVTDVRQRLTEAEEMLAAEERRSYVERTTGRNPAADALEREGRTARIELEALAARETATREQARALREQVGRLERQARQLRELERDRTIVEASLRQYVRQFEEARVNDQMQFVNVAVLEPVSAGASPVKPDVGLLMKLALGLGLIVSLALPFALDFADHRVKTDRDLEAAGVPVLAVFDHYAERTGTVSRRG